MFRITPTQKQIKKYFTAQSNDESKVIVPNEWSEFAETCDVASGGNIVKFKPYNYQIELANQLEKRSVIICKSRQLGISEFAVSYLLFHMCKNAGFLALVFSKTQADSSLLADRMKRMIQGLGLKTVTDNRCDIQISGGGRTLFRPAQENSARGVQSVSLCVIDEVAFLDNAQGIYEAMIPCMQMVENARCLLISTPNGIGDFYHQMLCSGNGDRDVEQICKDAASGEGKSLVHWVDAGGWCKFIVSWREHPKYGKNPNFLQETHEKLKLTWDVIEREYNLSFKDSAVGVFSSDLIRLNAVGNYEDEIDKSAEYYCGLDTSTTGADYTVFSILKFKKGKLSLVHLYRKRQQTSEYHLYQIGELISKFKPRKVGIEITGGVGQIYLENLVKQFKNTNIEAIRTTGDSKPIMISNMVLALEKEKLNYPPNSPLIDEMLSFRRDGKKLEAAPGKHDDIVMATAFAINVSPIRFDSNRVDFSKVKVAKKSDLLF